MLKNETRKERKEQEERRDRGKDAFSYTINNTIFYMESSQILLGI